MVLVVSVVASEEALVTAVAWVALEETEALAIAAGA